MTGLSFHRYRNKGNKSPFTPTLWHPCLESKGLQVSIKKKKKKSVSVSSKQYKFFGISREELLETYMIKCSINLQLDHVYNLPAACY
jgi:hypothetical protein